MKTLFIRLLAGGLAALLGACAVLPPGAQITTPVAKHAYVIAGTGSPTVLLEAGLGNGKESWTPVFARIAEQTQVFAYNRAGYWPSRSPTNTRDAATIVNELRNTLHALDLKPPFVLVGHSIGGTFMEMYARSYPQEVAGVVLVDSRHADFTRLCQIADAGVCQPPALLAALSPPGPKREMASADQTMEQVLGAGPFPQVPLVVLTSGKQGFANDSFQKLWLETQKSLAAMSENSTHTVCERCGHFVQRDNPDLVVEAIRAVVDQSRH